MQELLFLAHRIPYPPNKGDKIRSYHMLRYLGARFRVHLGCFIDDPADRVHCARLDSLCASTCYVDQAPAAARLRGLRGLLSGQPMSLPYYGDASLRHWAGRLLAGGHIGCALAYSGPMAQYLEDAPAGVRRVIDFVDVDSEKWRQYADSKPWPLALLYRREARRLLAYEARIARQFDAATFVSAAEAALFRRRAAPDAARIHHVSNGVDAAYFSSDLAHANPYAGAALVFTGAMDYWPNVDAVQWFAAQVWPVLRARFPALAFYIVGARPAPAVLALAQLPGVVVSGAVPDIRPYLAHAALAVAPLRIARGIQNKVLEAMAMGVTVLASPQALEGIAARPGEDIMLAADAGQFIARITALLEGQAGCGAAARRRVVRDYGWDSNLERLGLLLGLSPAHAAAPAPAEPAA